jgi:centromere/kinetochore protein ZW10
MSSQVSAEKLGDAILQQVEHGGFPQDEDVASASVPSSALPKLLEIVGKAKEDTKVCGLSHALSDQTNSQA